MLEELKEQVLKANLELKAANLVLFTWGNVSGIDHQRKLVVIKPSGVAYEELTSTQMVVVDLEGQVVEGDLHPSSDTPTHLELYRSLPEIGGIVHTHSTYATAWAQAQNNLPCLGTTHADYMYGPIPCTRKLRAEEIKENYELNTGKVIVETFQQIDYRFVPAVLVANHGPFTWGKDPVEAVHNNIVLEEVARMACITQRINPKAVSAPQDLIDKHFLRKHGINAYYGQNSARAPR